MIENMNKVFFTPGDIVTIKHDLHYKPLMLVKGKETRTIRGDDSTHFLGIKCFWFSTEGIYQEQIFSTKDLVHLTPKTIEACPDCGYPFSRHTCSKHKDPK